MPRTCVFTGKSASFGNRRVYRGQAITKGGFGLKPTGITRRKFSPNLQKVCVMLDGRPVRANVSAKAIRTGLVVKPLKRKFGYTRQQKATSAA